MPQDQPPRPDQTSTYYDSIQKLKPGSTLGSRYKIIRLIGSGGMGRVYLAHDNELNIEVALKVIRKDLLESQNTIDRFKNELLNARKVSHRNVVRIHDIGEADGEKYLTMSFIQGKSLKEVLKEDGAFPMQRAESTALQLCEAVAVAHEEGVVHRDLKPANILLDENGRVFVTDFGIARSLEFSGGTETGHIIGTPAYLSPEQSRGEHIDTRSDVYSLGLILYEIVAGELPFDNQNVNRFRNTGPGDVTSKLKKVQADVPSYYGEIIKRCLNPDPVLRYTNGRALLDDLKTQTARRTPVQINQKFAFIIIGVLILIAAGIVAYRQFYASPSQPPKKTDQVASARSVAVFPFANRTGNDEMKWIESAMADLIATDLENKSFRLVSSERIHQTFQDLKFSSQNIDDNSVMRLAEILDAEIVVQGTIVQAGSLLRADLKVIDMTQPGNDMYFKSVAAKPDDVFKMTESLAQQIREKFQQGKSSTESATKTPQLSVQSLKFFHQGNDQYRMGKFLEATKFYEQALKGAPNFAKAHLQLSLALEKMGEPEQSLSVLEKALQQIGTQDEKARLMIQARHSLLNGDLDKAVEKYNALCQKDPNNSEALFQLATTYEEKGDLKNAATTLTKLISIDPNHPQAAFHLGKDTVLMGEAEKGIHEYLLKALAVQTQLNNEYGKADVLNAIGVGYERLGRYDDAIRYYNDSIAIKERIGNKKGEAKSLSNVAKIYSYQGKYSEATKILNRTEKIYSELQDAPGEADVLNMFGVMNEDQGRFEPALQYYKKSLQIRKQIGNDRLTAQSYDNVGQIYFLTGQYDDAEVYWNQALSLRKQIGEESGIILSLQNMGFLQLDQGKLDQSMKTFLDALEQSRKIKYENAIAVSLGNLGTIYQYQGRYKGAIDTYREAIEILKKLDDKKGIAEYTRLLGNTFLEMGDLTSAEAELNKALQLAKEIQSFEMECENEVLLARLYLSKNSSAKAEGHINRALAIANEHDYQYGRVKAEITKGLMLEKSNPQESVRILSRTSTQAVDLRNLWIILESQNSLARSQLENRDPIKAIKTAQSGLASADSCGSLPYQYRFHSILSAAFKARGDATKAEAHSQSAKTISKSIQKVL